MSAESFLTDGWIAEYREALTSDPLVQSLSQPAEFTSLIEIGNDELLLDVDQGDIELKEDPTVADPWDFAVKGSAGAWERFARGDRDPEYANFISMTFQGAMSVSGETESHMKFEGDYRMLFAHLELLYEVFELMREVGGD